MEDVNPTTRCYPRTLAEAFPNDPENFEWFHPPQKNQTVANIFMGMAALCLWVMVAYLITAN